MKYFECDPVNLCEKAACCRNPETQPSLGVGDYIRLSKLLDKSLIDIWRDEGDVSLGTFSGMKPGSYLVTLGLLHDPCPYLTDDYGCGVYWARPLSCGGFPYLMFLSHDKELETTYKNYGCLQDVQLSGTQENYGKKIKKLMKMETDLDIEHFWRGDKFYADVSDNSNYFKLALQAVDRINSIRQHRVNRMMKSIEEMMELRDSGKLQQGISASKYRKLVNPIVYVLIADEIENRFKSLTPDVIKLYERTTKMWEKINRERPKQLVQIKRKRK